MKSKILSLMAGLCSLWLVVPASLADPFVFEFDMPAFDTFGNIGTTSTLTITVDNGGSSNLSQSWASDQFIQLSTDLTGPSSSTSIQNGVQSGAITTDGTGVPTLSFGPSNDYVFGREANNDRLIQVGRDCDYGIFVSDSIVGGVGCSSGGAIWPIVGRAVVAPSEPTAVPTMSVYGLALTMLGLLVLAGRRLGTRRQA